MTYTTKEKLEHLSNSIYKFICDYREYSNWYFFDDEIKDLQSVKDLLSNEDNGVDFMGDLLDTFNHLFMHKNLNNPKEENFSDTLFSIFKEYNSFINSYDKEYEINSLAIDLMHYAKDVDPYEYNDSYNDDDHAFNDMKKSLSTTSGVDTLIESICNDINYFASENDLSNSDILNNFKTANDLLIKLNCYSKTLEKEENKEMDM